MIELRHDTLHLTSPATHEDATASIGFQRTLRIPDDGTDYPLPAGLGPFPLRHVDDHPDTVSESWTRHGGVMLPMWRTEAMWIRFDSVYPWAVKIAAGKRCAITGGEFSMDLHADEQDYAVIPAQPWLDGCAVEEGRIRQFVAMSLGEGYTVEEQLSGAAEWGGIQIVAYPMTAAVWERIRQEPDRTLFRGAFGAEAAVMPMAAAPAPDMGMAAGGLMRQEVHADPHGIDVWDTDAPQRVFVHMCDAMVWRHVTGHEPPTVPPTAAEYARAGIPWFELAATGSGVGGGDGLSEVKSVHDIGTAAGNSPLADNTSVTPGKVVDLSPIVVTDGDW